MMSLAAPVTVARLGGSAARRPSSRPAAKSTFGAAIRGGVVGLPKRGDSVPSALAGNGGGNIGGRGGGGGGGGGWNGWGDDGSGMGGGGALGLAALPFPMYDLAGKPSLNANNVLILILDIILPFVGVYMYRRRIDKYVGVGLVLTFLPPLGIIYALLVSFGNFRF